MKIYNYDEKFEIITDVEYTKKYLISFIDPSEKNFTLDLVLNKILNGSFHPILKKDNKEITVILMFSDIKTHEKHILTKKSLNILKNGPFCKEFLSDEFFENYRDEIVNYENDPKLYNEHFFELWVDKQRKLNQPKIVIENLMLNEETFIKYIFGYEKLFSIPGVYQCEEILLHYDDIINVNIFTDDKYPYLINLIREKTVREIIKVKENVILLPLNNINLNNMSFIPEGRVYTKKEIKFLNQKKIKELCYYLKLGYNSTEIYETGILGKGSIYSNTRKLLVMGIFKRDEINIKFSDTNNDFLEKYYRKTMLQRWKSMIDRCYNENNESYINYGGRGIKVCDEWRDPDFGFENYYSDIINNIGHIPGEGYSLDRIKNNGNYTIGNVRWATISQQNFNRSFKRNKK